MIVVLFVMGRAQKSLSPDTEGALSSPAAQDGGDGAGAGHPAAHRPDAAVAASVVTGGQAESAPGPHKREPQP